jgi:ergothioneine biosynthesis protein EgtB
MITRTEAPPLLARYEAVRRATLELVRPLSAEDMQPQSMPETSPVKWHLAHTTWFFETFVLPEPRSRELSFLYNSYYDAIGPRHPRAERGFVTRPSLEAILLYRRTIDERVLELLDRGLAPEVAARVELGLNHEQQHQELILTDVKHLFSRSSLGPSYRDAWVRPAAAPPPPLKWIRFDERLAWIGAPEEGFAYDNERPRHRAFVEAFDLSSRLVTAGEYREFVRDGGYERPELWLSEGWAARTRHGWEAPLYWSDEGRSVFTLSGLEPITPGEPVAHVSWFEADAFARWKSARLPTEEEWEVAARTYPVAGNLLERGLLHPAPAKGHEAIEQLYGDVWEWTRSVHAPFPRYHPAAGALGEYNGKFMSGSYVLRGGSCLTPASHVRATYRNYFAPETRWQVAGIRLARDPS